MISLQTQAMTRESGIDKPAAVPQHFPFSSRFARFVAAISGFLHGIKVSRRKRTLLLCETLPLGEKRFLAIVQVEQQRFLIAATNQSISLLQCLEPSIHSTLREPLSTGAEFPDGKC
jgi:hypothetical protein